MSSWMRSCIVMFLLSATLSSRGFAQASHVVRLVAGPGKQEFRFEPSVITVKPNDVVTVFSNGGFDGIHGKLLAALKSG